MLQKISLKSAKTVIDGPLHAACMETVDLASKVLQVVKDEVDAALKKVNSTLDEVNSLQSDLITKAKTNLEKPKSAATIVRF